MAAEPVNPQAAGQGPAAAGGGTQNIGLPEIPGYRIEETLGRGSTGVVYRATQIAVEREVALKVLHAELVGRPKAVRRLQREARTTARLTHPNIVTAIDLGQSADGLWWYAMELVRGESLAARLKRTGSISEREALRLFAPLVDALDHAFQHGVVHRDIKPANILIDERSRARLVDLGLAFREDDPLITSPGGTLGTPHYVSPEQARKPESADARSDIWSLGATLYHALCGCPPFPGQSVAEILSGVLYGRVRDPQEMQPGISRNMSLVLRKCLTRDPAGRYQTPSELLADLERLREREPVQVQVKALDPLAHEPRSGLRWITGSVLGVLALGLLGFLVGQRPDPLATEQAPGATLWPELEELAGRAQGPEIRVAAALADFRDLGQPPARHKQRHEQVEEALLSRYRVALASFQQRTAAEVQRLLIARNFERALKLVSLEGLQEHAQIELAPDPSQIAEVIERVRPAELRSEVETALEAYESDLKRRIAEHFRDAVYATVANDVKAGHWRSARAQLERDPLDHLADARIVLAGLPAYRVANLEAGVKADLTQRLAELDRDWRRQDLALVRWVEEQAAQLARALQSRTLKGSAADELARLYRSRVAELGVAPDQGLEFISNDAPAALESRARELTGLELQLVEEDARSWLARELENKVKLMAERRFSVLREGWERARERGWLAPVSPEIELELRAALLLEDLLERAARGVAKRDGESVELLVGSIRYRGRLEAGVDPLSLGFHLRPSPGAPLLLALRPLESANAPRAHVLTPEVVEYFAGLPADPAQTEAIGDRLARALLRHASGDTSGAQRCLPFPPSGDHVLDRLAERFAAELGRLEETERLGRSERERDARERLNLVLRTARDARLADEIDNAVKQIDLLLSKDGDLEPIAERAGELRELRAGLLETPGAGSSPDFARAFGPTRVEDLGDRMVKLHFDFGSSYQGEWSRGDWRADAEGWFATAPREGTALSIEDGWPRLMLGAPLDIDGPLIVSFTFEQLQDSGPPRLLVASIAGVHILLKGGSQARVLVGSGGPLELSRLVDEVDRKGKSFAGLARGERYTLEIELQQRLGKAIVKLDGNDASGKPFGGREIARNENPRPEIKTGTAGIVLRSLEPIRLLEATVTARRL
jgi:hypothetical protein